jgi:hypothetical protein
MYNLIKLALRYWYIIVIVLLAIAGIVFGNLYFKQLKETKRWESNYNVAVSEMEILKTKNGELYYKVGELELDKQELKYSKDSTVRAYASKIESMGVKLRNYEHIIGAGLVYRDTIVSLVQDTNIVIGNDTVDKVCRYIDKYNFVETYFSDRICNTVLEVQVPIVASIYKEKNKDIPWLKRIFSKKENKLVLMTDNPKVKITDITLISNKKKR